MRRSCPALAAAPARFVRPESVALSGPSWWVPAGSDTRRAYRPGSQAPEQRSDRMATELEHSFTTKKPIDESFATVTDLERVIPCVEGGRVIEVTGENSVKAEIDIAMGAMSMKFMGTVDVAEKDADAHRALLRVKSREAGGQGHANADVVFQLNDGGGTIHTSRS